MLWGTLDNLDMNTSHTVLTVRPDSPALQAILIFEDAPLLYFRNYGWGTLNNLDMNTSHPVLTVRPDSPALQAPGFANRAVGCPQTLIPVCTDDDACGIKVPDRVYSSCAVYCASLSLIRPPRSRPRFRPRSHPRPRVCVCVFIKLHITAQSGLVIVVILCHSR